MAKFDQFFSTDKIYMFHWQKVKARIWRKIVELYCFAGIVRLCAARTRISGTLTPKKSAVRPPPAFARFVAPQVPYDVYPC
jgi:hypothetical protein